MIRRPINSQFNEPVLAKIKRTTIRDKAWPVGVPIMLYNWTGKAYRTKQRDVEAIIVEHVEPIQMIHSVAKGRVLHSPYSNHKQNFLPLWKTEGFKSEADFQDWFRMVIEPGDRVEKFLMHFNLMEHCQACKGEWWRYVKEGKRLADYRCPYPDCKKAVEEAENSQAVGSRSDSV